MGLNVSALASYKDRVALKYFKSYKGRQVLPGQRVEVYRNLSFKDQTVYSIRDHRSGLVLGHATNILLNNCWFTVNTAARKRVIRDQKKNVCAWIEGSFGVLHMGDDKIFVENSEQVRFNPYMNETFVRGWDQDTTHILVANVVYIDGRGVFASGL